MNRTLRNGLALVGTLSFLALSGALWWAAIRFPRARVARVADALSAARLDGSVRWRRPPLRSSRGLAQPAGLASEDVAAIRALPSAPLRRLHEEVHAGRVGERSSRWVRAHEPLVEALASRAHGPWSAPPAELDGQTLSDAALLLLGDAGTRAPSACLRRAAEAIRMGQDGAASPRWELRRIGVDVPHSARPLVLRCAAAASPEERREAADQLARLAATPPPIAVAVRRQVATRGADLAEEAALELEHALFGGFGEAYRYGLRGAVERLGALEAPDQAPDPRRYPEGLRAALPEARIVTQTDAAAQASLRALAIAVAALAEGLPARPRALDDPRLADPFTGEPFEWTRDESGGRLRSPGPSGLGVLDGPIELRVSPGEG